MRRRWSKVGTSLSLLLCVIGARGTVTYFEPAGRARGARGTVTYFRGAKCGHPVDGAVANLPPARPVGMEGALRLRARGALWQVGIVHPAGQANLVAWGGVRIKPGGARRRGGCGRVTA